MSSLDEGVRVSYVGDGRDGRALGERGRILAKTGRARHVKWDDNSITLVDEDDLAVLRSTTGAARALDQDELADSLDVGPVHIGLRGTFDVEGCDGVLRSLTAAGQLVGLTAIAEETRSYAESRLRQDPGLIHATAQLDPEEADDLIAHATALLLRQASGADDA